MKIDYDKLASQIWEDDYIQENQTKRHKDKYYISPKSITVEEAMADGHKVLDIRPEFCGIDIEVEEWQEKFMDDPRMIAAMAKLLWQKLKRYGKYAFNEEPDWLASAKEYLSNYERRPFLR